MPTVNHHIVEHQALAMPYSRHHHNDSITLSKASDSNLGIRCGIRAAGIIPNSHQRLLYR